MSSSEGSAGLGRQEIQKRMISGFAWQGATKGVVQITSWISIVWVARILDPVDYGIMAVAGVFTGFAFRVSELGLAEGLITRPSVDIETQESVFSLGLLLALLLYLVLYFVAPTAANIYDMPEIEAVIRVAGLAIFLGATKAVPFATVMRDLNFRYRSLVAMGAQFVQIVALLVLAINGFGYWSLVWSFLLSQLVTAVFYWRLYPRFPRLRGMNSGSLDAAKFGIKLTLNRMSFFLLQSSPAAIIGKVLGSSLLGYYNMAHQLAVLPLDKIANVFKQVTFPAIAKVDPDRSDDAKYLFLQTHKYLLLVAQPALIGIALVAPDLVPIVLTEKWAPIVPLLQIFCAFNVLRLSSMIFSPVLLGRDRPELVLSVTLTGLAILPAAIYFGTGYGLIGVMVAWAMVQPILFSVALRFLMKSVDMRLSEFFRSWVPASSSSLVMIVVVVLLGGLLADSSPVNRMGLQIVAGGVSYLLAIIIFHNQEVQSILRIVRSIAQRRGKGAATDGER